MVTGHTTYAAAWIHGYLSGAGWARAAVLRWDARRLADPRLAQPHITAAARQLGIERHKDSQGRTWWALPTTGGDQ